MKPKRRFLQEAISAGLKKASCIRYLYLSLYNSPISMIFLFLSPSRFVNYAHSQLLLIHDKVAASYLGTLYTWQGDIKEPIM